MGAMTHTSSSPLYATRARVGVGLAAVGVFIGLMALGGCMSSDEPAHIVTVTAEPSVPTPASSTTATPKPAATTPKPATTTPALPLPGGMVLTVSQGEASPSCTNSVCYFVNLAWSGLEKGNHQVQCVTDQTGVGVFSDNSYYFDAADGDRELKCFMRNTGDEVWVVIDGVYESNHVDWE